ncbi:MAG: phosphate regulon sensor histidine kinase PhoR [Halothiobacillaceae bacterium]
MIDRSLKRWREEMAVFAVPMLVAVLAGALSGLWCWSLLAGFAIYMLSLIGRLTRLLRASRQRVFAVPVLGLPGLVQDRFRRARTAWFKRQRRLIRLLRRYHHSAMAVPDATVVLGVDYRIEWMNRAAQSLLGLGVRDHGLRIDNLIRQPSFVTWLADAPLKQPLEIVAPGDEQRSLSLRMEAYGDDRYLLIGRDVTAIHRLQEVRQDFVANVSHELRTPLTVLSGYIETLQDMHEPQDEAMSRILHSMDQQGDRMRRIVEDLLLLSRLETSTPSDEYFERIEMPQMLDGVLVDAEILSGDDAHQFHADIDRSLNLHAITREIYSALSNLVFNAVKYTPAGGRIDVRWYRNADGAAVFEVEDTGIGIDPRHIPRLTERFYRVDVGRSRARGGTGLGLAIVKHVLIRHHAPLHIESELGRGSLFRVTFPPSLVLLT